MSDTIKERERAFEAKFALDEEMLFRATARRNKLLGLWAAEIMGLKGDDAQSYATEVIRSDFSEPGDGDVLRKVFGDLNAKACPVDEQAVKAKMAELLALAKADVIAERRPG